MTLDWFARAAVVYCVSLASLYFASRKPVISRNFFNFWEENKEVLKDLSWKQEEAAA